MISNNSKMECFFCQEMETVRGVTPCCYQPVCESCFNDKIYTCTCGQPFSHYLEQQEKPPSETVQYQVNSYIENKKAYLVLIKTYQWKIRTLTFDAYTKELDHTASCLLKLCTNYFHLVNNGVFVEPPVIPTFVPLGVCKKNPQCQWCVVSKDFDHFLEKNCDKPWDWYFLSINPNLSFQYVLDHPELPWYWYGLSRDVPFKYVLDHPKLPWNWYGLSENPNIPFQYVLDHPEKPWNWYGLSENPNIPFQCMLDHPEFLCWDEFSRNPTVSFQDVLNHPELPWDWYWLSTKVSIQDVVNHPEKPWSWSGLSVNKFDLR